MLLLPILILSAPLSHKVSSQYTSGRILSTSFEQVRLQGDPHLSNIFSDHMVLQRDKAIEIFGEDPNASTIQVEIAGKKVIGKPDASGHFSIKLPKMKAGGPYELKITGSKTWTFSDVLVGEVWVCSGQSNMEWIVQNSKFLDTELAGSDPNIRMFTVSKNAVGTQAADVDGRWVLSSPTTTGSFSAVGFAFAKALYRELHVPIGMIHTSWGGTPAEAWTTKSTMLTSPITKPIVDRTGGIDAQYPAQLASYQKAMVEWQRKVLSQWDNRTTEAAHWDSFDFDDSSWSVAKVPGAWDANFDGVGWYRLSVNLTAEQATSFSDLSLGPIDDLDQTYVNGQPVGFTDMSTPNYWSAKRNYSIKRGVLRPGRNVIAVRVTDTGGGGGFMGDSAELRLGNMNLAGDWKFKIEAPLAASSGGGQAPQPPIGSNNPNYPGSLMNGMVAPFIPYTIRGAIWYQGESNAGRSYQYKTLFPMMIQDWRNRWKSDFSFYWVQLANYMAANPNQFDSGWAELREAQTQTQKLRNSGQAVILDIGEANDIHPKNKREVGERLARVALAKDYHMKVVYSGPAFGGVSLKEDGSTVVRFKFGKGLKTTDGQAPRAFAIRSTVSGSKWMWADAKIEGETVVLSHPSIKGPVEIRYAWQDNPQVNLVNAEGLPAVPFQTDKSDWVTLKNR